MADVKFTSNRAEVLAAVSSAKSRALEIMGGKAESYKEGIELAKELIDSGKAKATLEKMIEVSNR